MEERSGRPPTALPPRLAAAIDARLEGRPRAELAASARRISECYRAGGTTSDAIRDETDALAYALTRMPATYAAAAAALARLAEHWPDFLPRSVLDVGCGLGAASYAASTRWPEIEATFLDRSGPFLALAQALAKESRFAALGTIIEAEFAYFLRALAAGDRAETTRQALSHASQFELVVASYALTEIADDALPRLADGLWARTSGALVIVEPGAPHDYARLMTVRNRLVELGATILAPCPHNGPCRLTAPEWCHFSVRLARSRAHKMLKGADAPFEDEKFSYLIAASGGAPSSARLIGPVRRSKPGATLRLCAKDGIRETLIRKRDKSGFEKIRRKDWGDSLDALSEEAG